MFLEVELNKNTGEERGQQKLTREQIIEKFPGNYDLRAWLSNARIGSVFSLLSQGYRYKRLSD
jgi:hypothetical protein